MRFIGANGINIGVRFNNFFWHCNVVIHRVGRHAIEYADGSKEWFCNGKKHREDGPAVVYSDRTKVWYVNGLQVDGVQPI